MATDHWHSEFNPAKFLSRVDLLQLIERNEAYNESRVGDLGVACILCGRKHSSGILLNDRSFLCESCYAQVALISYPERYEVLRRQFVLAAEARRLAWESFKSENECVPQESSLVYAGWLSALLAFLRLELLALTVTALLIGYYKNYRNKLNVIHWLHMKAEWEDRNPAPKQPTLKHFHDPTAILTTRDHQILKIFNHWPGYPPFWGYLREVVLLNDGGRCQVSGCPSRLELHIHHIKPVSEGGQHAPNNLVSLCDFHHALEPEKGHERIWGSIKTRYFTLVRGHERANRSAPGKHAVRAHLKRLQLAKIDELKRLAETYGFACPHCGNSFLKLSIPNGKNVLLVECSVCNQSTDGPLQLTEETGPRLAELLRVTKNSGRWNARWEMLAERTGSVWGAWGGSRATRRRKEYKKKVDEFEAKPACPACGASMRLIRPKPQDSWAPFWGCARFKVTGCKGSVRYVREQS